MKKQQIVANFSEWTELSNSFSILHSAGLPIRFLLNENNKKITQHIQPIHQTISELLQNNIVLGEQGQLSLKSEIKKEAVRKYSDYMFLNEDTEILVLREIKAMQTADITIELTQWSIDRPFIVEGEKIPLSSLLEQHPLTKNDSAVLDQLMETVLYFE